MLEDVRSGCIEVEPPKGKGEIISCPCSHHSWRRKDALDESESDADKS
jgi:hypothetical protein